MCMYSTHTHGTHTCAYAQSRTHTHVHIHTICTWEQHAKLTHLFTHTHIHSTDSHMCIHTDTHICIHTYAHTHMHTHTHAHTHIRTHTYIHACMDNTHARTTHTKINILHNDFTLVRCLSGIRNCMCMCACICPYVHMRVCAYVCARMGACV